MNEEEQLAKINQRLIMEEEFAQTAQVRFQQNMEAFQKYFPDIYETFINFQPCEKFKLILNTNGTPNIIDYDSGVPMYSDDPISQVNQQAERIIANPKIINTNFTNIADLKNEADFLHLELIQKISKHYCAAAENLSLNEKLDKHIPSQVILGIGLGYHLMPLREATIASYISIFEPNPDYFFASLYCFDWKTYLETIDADGSYLFIGVGDSEVEIYQTLKDRTRDIGAFSVVGALFYLHYPSSAMSRLMAKMKLESHQLSLGFGFFDDALMSIAHTVNLIKKSPAILKPEYSLPKKLAQYPVFIVANGPSLDNDIEVIKKMQDHVIIAACNSATTALLSHDIVPDFHVCLERTKSTADFIEAHIDEEDRKKINLLVLNLMYPEVADLFPWTGVALKGGEPGTSLYQLASSAAGYNTSTLGYCNPLVGNMALSFFAHMGCENIYLFGNDNGYKHKDHHHSKSSYYYDKSGKAKYESISLENEFEVEGNFSEKMMTESFLFLGKQQMDLLLASFQGSALKCYNCSDGVKVEGAITLPSSEIMLDSKSINKQAIISELKATRFEPPHKELKIESLLDFEVFEIICNNMIEILNQKLNSRSDCLQILLAQLRYFNSISTERRYQHLYLLLKGQCAYVSSILLSLLYRYGDEKEIVPYFNDALSLWKEFIIKSPQHYRDLWDKNSRYGFDYDNGVPRVEPKN
ncbi:6-hydroxymethylpterin diphosphokinase MptE-like protein [Colwelliaceae bacterium 6441]